MTEALVAPDALDIGVAIVKSDGNTESKERVGRLRLDGVGETRTAATLRLFPFPHPRSLNICADQLAGADIPTSVSAVDSTDRLLKRASVQSQYSGHVTGVAQEQRECYRPIPGNLYLPQSAKKGHVI